MNRNPLGRPMPTGPNPLTPLHDFVIVQGPAPVALCHQCGHYAVTIDPVREVGHFQHEKGLYEGRFWIAGRTYLGAEHLLPRDVQRGLIGLGYEVM